MLSVSARRERRVSSRGLVCHVTSSVRMMWRKGVDRIGNGRNIVYMEATTATVHDTTTCALHRHGMTLCHRCGMRADADPQFHAERYGHWPTVDHDGTLYNSDHLWATWAR